MDVLYQKYKRLLKQAEDGLRDLRTRNLVPFDEYKRIKDDAEIFLIVCDFIKDYPLFYFETKQSEEKDEYRERSYQLCGRHINR